MAFESTLITPFLGSSKMSRFTRLFMLLSLTAFVLTWAVMLVNGTIDALIDAAKSGTLSDGRPLKTSYTGILLVDFAISVLIAFFEPVTNGMSAGPRLLLVAFFPSAQSAMVWILIEGLRMDTNVTM